MIGTILGNRYRILEIVGEGGMALVYKAEDTLLNREVAIKVLRPQYASDAEFVERFRREAQSAASLSHPNVVNIYDVGRQNDVDYIVMEYVRGVDLKEIIRREAPLSVGRTLDITRQIAEALHHAHQNNIVHRDIKPHNILMTHDGRVKVTDFGIARAASVSSVTQTGVVMGSVQYFSPEQARGVTVGQSSDLYSLGCVMYELLTGNVPFKGDTPIAVALKHIQENPVPPRQIRPGIPVAVESIVMKALEKTKERRYESASEMVRDILRVEGRYEAPAGDELEATQVMSKVETPVRRGLPWWLIAMLAVVLPFIGLLVYLLLPQTTGPAVRVPVVVGLNESQARQVLKESGLRMRVIGKDYNEQWTRGIVFYQDTTARASVRRMSVIGVKISLGAETVQIPDLRGLTEAEARLQLENAQLAAGTVTSAPSPDVETGLVSGQTPAAGQRSSIGGKVDLVISAGAEDLTIEVPYLIGRNIDDARPSLESLGLAVGRLVPQSSSTYNEGEIMEQNPLAGEKVPRGTTIDFTISSGSGRTDNTSVNQAAMNSLEISVEVPPGPPNQSVRIVVQDQGGDREVYRGVHQPGERFTQTVKTRGHGKVLLYINEKLFNQYPF